VDVVGDEEHQVGQDGVEAKLVDEQRAQVANCLAVDEDGLQVGTRPLPLAAATSTRKATELASCTPVARPESRPRSSTGAISGSRALYGSTATLKKIENRKIRIASGTRLLA
jgi:hypothetical protein